MGNYCVKPVKEVTIVTSANPENKMETGINIYILKCEHDKYYIGKSKNLDLRLESHFQNNGSEWTKLHKPVEVISIFKNCDDFDEDKYTKKYMAEYGIDNVRGGSYCQIEINRDTKNFILKEITASQDRCFRCGEEGHFANRCGLVCARCGRKNSHRLEDCYAKTTIKGELI